MSDGRPMNFLSTHKRLVAALVCVGAVAWAVSAKRHDDQETSRRMDNNQIADRGALRAISEAQALFREADRESDGNLDYGSLAARSTAGASGGLRLIDAVLG